MSAALRAHLNASRVGWFERVLGGLVATALLVDAYVHVHDAHFYDSAVGPLLSEGQVFRIEAVIAAVLAVLVVVWPRRPTWAASVLVLGSAFGAVMLYHYVDVGAFGPLPNMYEPTWVASGKVMSAWVEGVGFVLAVIGLAASVLVRRRFRRGTSVPGAARPRPDGRCAPVRALDPATFVD